MKIVSEVTHEFVVDATATCDVVDAIDRVTTTATAWPKELKLHCSRCDERDGDDGPLHREDADVAAVVAAVDVVADGVAAEPEVGCCCCYHKDRRRRLSTDLCRRDVGDQSADDRAARREASQRPPPKPDTKVRRSKPRRLGGGAAAAHKVCKTLQSASSGFRRFRNSSKHFQSENFGPDPPEFDSEQIKSLVWKFSCWSWNIQSVEAVLK